MHTCLRGPKANLLFTNLWIDPDFPSLANGIAEPCPDMNSLVAAFTVSEKSNNTGSIVIISIYSIPVRKPMSTSVSPSQNKNKRHTQYKNGIINDRVEPIEVKHNISIQSYTIYQSILHVSVSCGSNILISWYNPLSSCTVVPSGSNTPSPLTALVYIYLLPECPDSSVGSVFSSCYAGLNLASAASKNINKWQNNHLFLQWYESQWFGDCHLPGCGDFTVFSRPNAENCTGFPSVLQVHGW